MEIDEQKEVFNSGISITVKAKRGSGTRDQDTVKAKIRGKTTKEVEQKKEKTMEMVEEIMTEIREVQPGEEDE